MKRYKIELEYLFTNKGYSNICSFLKTSEPIDLSKLLDNKGNTGLHHAAFNPANIKLLYKYLDYMEKYCSRFCNGKGIPADKDPQEYFNAFINTKNNDGFTPLHIAAYKGNYKALDELCKSGADYKLTTQDGENVLHLAAQGGMVETFIYFQSRVDINCRDGKNSTPLHWATYKNNESIVTYLLSRPDIDINATDKDQQTPLHLAAGIGATNIVKKLLIAGADRSTTNSSGKTAVTIAKEESFRSIERILSEKYSCLEFVKLNLNLKTVYKPQERSLKKPLFFISCFVALMLLRHLLFTLEPGYQYLQFVDIAFNVVLLFLYLTLIFSSKRPKPQKFMDFLQGNINLNKVCLACTTLKPSRSFHCNICKMCITRYDHHCFWINNCVGKRNLKKFISFIMIFLVFLFEVLLIAVLALYAIFSGEDYLLGLVQTGSPRLITIGAAIYSVAVGGMALGLCFPMMVLIYIQVKNLLLNRTTYQRHKKMNITNFTESSSHLLSSQIKSNKETKYSISNALAMCQDTIPNDLEINATLLSNE